MSEQVGIIITAEDRTGPAVAKSSKAVDAMRGKFQAVGKQVGAMPGQFGAASAAMMMMGSSTSQMGGVVADAGNKITAVASMMMMGGPLGIALAAATLAVMAVSAAFDAMNESAKKANARTNELIDTMSKSLAVTTSHVTQVKVMRAELAGIADASLKIGLSEEFAEVTEQMEDLRREKLELQKAFMAAPAINKAQLEQLDTLTKTIETLDSQREAIMHVLLATKAKEDAEEAATKKTATAIVVRNAELDRSRGKVKQLEDQITVAGLSAAEGKQRLIAIEIWELSTTENLTKGKRAYLASLGDQLELLDQIVAKEGADEAAQGRADRDREIQQENLSYFEGIESKKQEIRDANEQRRIDIAEDTAATEQRLARETQQMQLTGINAVGDAMAAVATAAILDHENMGKVAIQAVVSTTKTIIMAYAAQAAAGAIAGNSAIPVVGIVLGMAAASVAFALVEAYISQLPSFAGGGVVPGISQGYDSVLARLEPEEMVLPVEISRAMRTGRAPSSTGNVTIGGGDQALSGGGTTTVVNNFSSLEVPDRARTRRMVRDMGSEMREVNRRGQLFKRRAFGAV